MTEVFSNSKVNLKFEWNFRSFSRLKLFRPLNWPLACQLSPTDTYKSLNDSKKKKKPPPPSLQGPTAPKVNGQFTPTSRDFHSHPLSALTPELAPASFNTSTSPEFACNAGTTVLSVSRCCVRHCWSLLLDAFYKVKVQWLLEKSVFCRFVQSEECIVWKHKSIAEA